MRTQYLDKVIEIDDMCPVYRGSFGLNGELSEPNIIAKVREILEKIKNPIMLDIGACTGSYALLDKSVNVQIHSFEPVNKTFRILEKNIKSNNSKTICYNYAVSNYNGTGTLKTVGHDGAIALSLVDGSPSFTRRDTVKSKVKVITIDSWCEERNIIPDFIKIDVEGGELRVLEGAKKIIDKYSPVILCEYSQENANQFGYQIGDIINLLQNMDIGVKRFKPLYNIKYSQKDANQFSRQKGDIAKVLQNTNIGVKGFGPRYNIEYLEANILCIKIKK